MNTAELTLFYDGTCPFCAAERARLRHWNTAGKLAFVDIADAGFDPAPLGVEMAALDRELHSQKPDGEILVGIDSMLAAYTLVGKGFLVFPLRVKLLRPVLANLYRNFARNRYRLSRLLGYKAIAHCDGAVCKRINPFFDR
ncbi:MAG: thiol-disulfide oxidoreductase DCC family protein [Burkholderiaceae bacterium]